jgi:hypothetical protein
VPRRCRPGKEHALSRDVAETFGDVVRGALRDEGGLHAELLDRRRRNRADGCHLAPSETGEPLRHCRDAVDAREHDPVVARHRVDRVLERTALRRPDLDQGDDRDLGAEPLELVREWTSTRVA